MENSRKLTPQAQSHCCALSDVLGFKQKKTFITFAHFVDTTSLVFELPLEIICFILSFLKPVVSKDRAYQFNSKWGNVNCQMFAFPRGLCVNDKNKQTYVSDTKERIQIFDKNHTLISSFSGKGFILPTGLDVNERTGKIYVCDSYNHRIQSFDFDGNHISVFGKHGTSEGMFDSPFYISSVGDDGLVFIADYGNKRVQVMNEEGKFLYSFGDRSSNFSSYPTGIAASRFSDKVFVGEEETGKIHVFSQKGDFLFSFGRNGKDPGCFNWPYGMSTDEEDNVFIADQNNHRIQVCDGNGRFLLSFSASELNDPMDVDVDEDGTVYYCDRLNHQVQVWK